MAFDDLSSVSDDAIKALWCAVLQQATEDAKAPMPVFRAPAQAAKKEGETDAEYHVRMDRRERDAIKRHKQDLSDWRSARDYIGSRSFREVCALCGIESDAAEEHIRRAMTAE